jgi:hypothetical protein
MTRITLKQVVILKDQSTMVSFIIPNTQVVPHKDSKYFKLYKLEELRNLWMSILCL